nr:hypothetical protein Iba_chr09aCG9660 [Ipomoea batatas]
MQRREETIKGMASDLQERGVDLANRVLSKRLRFVQIRLGLLSNFLGAFSSIAALSCSLASSLIALARLKLCFSCSAASLWVRSVKSEEPMESCSWVEWSASSIFEDTETSRRLDDELRRRRRALTLSLGCSATAERRRSTGSGSTPSEKDTPPAVATAAADQMIGADPGCKRLGVR